MGIRIHKAIGYMAKHPKPNVLENLLYEKNISGEVATILNNIKKPIIDNPNGMLYKNTKNRKADPYPNFFHEIVHRCLKTPDSKFSNPFIIVPPSMMNTWYRWDDGIDYIEETLSGSPSEFRIKILERALHPFDGWMMLDGSKAPEEGSEEYFTIDKSKMIPYVPESVRIIASHLGFNTHIKPAISSWWA